MACDNNLYYLYSFFEACLFNFSLFSKATYPSRLCVAPSSSLHLDIVVTRRESNSAWRYNAPCAKRQTSNSDEPRDMEFDLTQRADTQSIPNRSIPSQPRRTANNLELELQTRCLAYSRQEPIDWTSGFQSGAHYFGVRG